MTQAVRQPGLAEIVASELREDLCGRLPDGSIIPNQDALAGKFGVSRASLREAIRIPEAEHLVSVRRGKLGGVMVHSPTCRAAAYTLGLMLQAERVSVGHFVVALDQIEPACARRCAQRRDRVASVVPQFQDAVQRLEGVVESHGESYFPAEQLSHRRVVRAVRERHNGRPGGCSALSAIQGEQSLKVADRHGVRPNRELRTHGVEAHQRISEVIKLGKVDDVAVVFRWHRSRTRSLESLPYEQLIRVSVPNGASLRAR